MRHATRQANLFETQDQAITDGYHGVDYEATMPGIVRPRLAALLSQVEASSRMPWAPREAHINAMLFHNMSNWLPEAERDSLRLAFARELKRLGGAAA